jgi:hypothetical protein
VNIRGKFGGDTIHIGSGISNQIPSPGMANLLLLVLSFLCKDRLPIIIPLLLFLDRFTKLQVHITIGMVNTNGKFGGDTIQNGSHRSNQIPSPGLGNLLLLLLRFL